MKKIEEVIKVVEKHENFFRNSLPMIASENITSETIRNLSSSDLMHRYAEGKVGNRFYQGCEFIDMIEETAIKTAKELFKADHVNLQPISGLNANLAAFFAMSKPGDTIMVPATSNGGHVSYTGHSAAGVRGLRVDYIPFDRHEMNIDVDKMIEKVRKKKPKLIVFGSSLFLFPHPVKEIRNVADEFDTKIIYDASHVLGLIAGKKFQDPLREGADVVTSSTHKTFPGPQGGLILCTHPIANKIDEAVFPGTVSNHHLHHLAGLAVALAEMLEFGESYASQTILNARVLAQELYELGLDVLCSEKGFTESHQVVLDVSRQGGGAKAATDLERSRIITNKNLLPQDDMRDAQNPSGLRLGTQELTKLGMKEEEISYIAELIKMVLVDKKDVSEEVMELRKNYRTVHYCFDEH